jgi:hypothetical protein
MRMNDDQNRAFANDPRRIEAENRLHEAVRRVKACLKNDGNAGYYLNCLPPLMKELEAANENLIVIEATVEAEVIGKERWHG